MLKFANCTLKLPTQIHFVEFIEKEIRNDISFINTRHLNVTNSDEKIVLINVNDLYGLAQTMKLPTENFNFIPESEYQKFDWSTIDTETDMGYILEVDLEYPKHLQSLHSDFPLAPALVHLNYSKFSPFCKSQYKNCSGDSKYNDNIVLNTLNSRLGYVVHFKNLKLYLNLGMKIQSILQVLRFTQKNFLKPFIEHCTLARQNSATILEQDQFKKVANSAYGRTILNARNYLDIKLNTNETQLLKFVSDPTFKNYIILDENLVQTNHFTPVILHNKPIFVDFTISELSKHFMYDFYYNNLLKNAPCKIELGFADTDSFLFKVSKPDLFFEHIKPFLDFSNYPQSHPFHSIQNKAKLGFFKDKLKGKLKCLEFIGLCTNCYALKLKEDNAIIEKKTCNGLGRITKRNSLKFKHYKKRLFKSNSKKFDFHSIHSLKKLNISSIKAYKRSLSHFDFKRWIFNCGIHSVPYGSGIIKKEISVCPKC